LPKFFPKASLQSDCPKAAMLENISYSPKWFPKTILQSGSRNSKTAAESCSPKLRPKAKLVPKAAPQSCGSLELLLKAAVQSCRAKLLLKAAPAPQSCSPNRFSATPKTPPQSGYPKAVMLQMYSPK